MERNLIVFHRFESQDAANRFANGVRDEAGLRATHLWQGAETNFRFIAVPPIVVVEQFDGTAPKLVHKGGGIGRIYQRGSRQRCGGDKDEQAGQKGTAHHVGRTSAKSWSYPIA